MTLLSNTVESCYARVPGTQCDNFFLVIIMSVQETRQLLSTFFAEGQKMGVGYQCALCMPSFTTFKSYYSFLLNFMSMLWQGYTNPGFQVA